MSKNNRRQANIHPADCSPSNGTGYIPRERVIFRYWNGSKIMLADPMRIQAGLLDLPDFEADLKIMGLQAEEAQKEARAALMRIAAGVRKIFGIEELHLVPDTDEECGLTDAECVALMMEFIGFITECKKKVAPWLISAKPTEAESSAAGDSPIPNGTDSTSTEAAPSIVGP